MSNWVNWQQEDKESLKSTFEKSIAQSGKVRIYTFLHSVSQSGTTRYISAYVPLVVDGKAQLVLDVNNVPNYTNLVYIS